MYVLFKSSFTFCSKVRIENDSEGHSYETLFGRFFESDVIEVAIEDPYIRAHHQIINLLRLCELMVKKCPDLKTVIVRTSRDPQNPSEQANKFEEINFLSRTCISEFSRLINKFYQKQFLVKNQTYR